VYDLIREAEENGAQHVFYYRPAGIPKVLAVDEIGQRLWGEGWREKTKFPRVNLAQDQFVFSDLRQFLPERKPLDWVLKIYGHEFADRATDIVKEISDTRYTREFIREERRMVIVIRWNNPGLLEIRLPRLTESRKQLTAWLELTWQMIAPAINPNLYTKWDLSKARAKMIAQQEKNQKVYRCSHSRVQDGYQNIASFECNAPQGDLFASEGVVESVKRLIGSTDGECTQLRTSWLAKEKDDVPSRDVTTVIGLPTHANEVVFTAQCTSRDVDYVTDQLRFFSK
jgi:transcription initiation factor IIE alpha subunit